MVLYTVEGFESPPTVEQVAKRLGVLSLDIDPSFGIVLIDPQRGMYGVQIPENRVWPRANDSEEKSGPWSSPPIAGFE